MTPQNVEFGKKYHKAAVSTQAGTMIHEATHYLGDTGDYIHDGKMLKGSNELETKQTGYASKQSFYKTPNSLNGDKAFANMRDGHTDKKGNAVPATKNLHDNAESYAQFASLCANAKLRRRDLHMYRRALAVGDGETAAYYLAKRNSCALPKDYFAKKAAAKAGAAKTGAKTIGSKVASTKKTTGGRTLSTKGKAGAAKSLLRSGKTVGRVASKSSLGKSKLGAVKHLANGRVAKSVSKVAGSRHAASKVAGKRLTAKAGAIKHIATGNKHVARPTANKHVAKTVRNKRVTKAANKRVARPVTKHTAQRASRPGRPAVHAKAAPRPAAQKTVAKVTPKKGRRDLELEYPL
jgi:hypothetical protein